MNFLALFDTDIGRCGIAWNANGIVGVQLPEKTPSKTRMRLMRLCPDADDTEPPKHIQRVIDDISGLLRGEKRALRGVTLDMTYVPEFSARVYDTARAIPPGRTRTYGELARAIGAPDSARAVGQALGRNPFPIIVPCHRVLAANGKLGGFSANGGVNTKLRMLAIEGYKAENLDLFDA